MVKGLIVVQARFGSTRLPGKVLRTLNGLPIVYHVLKRAEQLGRVVLATPDDPGPEQDVLQRFVNVALEYPDVNLFVRLTGDCPLLDVALARRVIAAWTPDWDIITTPSSMDGLDTEVFTRTALWRTWAETNNGDEREHVTPWMKRNLRCRVVSISGTYRWSVDDEVGLDFVRRVYAACEYCASGVPHHSNATGSIGGSEGRAPIWELHDLGQRGLAECTAWDIRKERMGGAVYQSA